MKKKLITIRMPKKMLKQWLADLRSGKIKQGKGLLHDGLGYCCLGVLQCRVSGGKVEYKGGKPGGLPTYEWLRKNGIEFYTVEMADSLHPSLNPDLPPLGKSAAGANDRGVSFSRIADAIEDCAEGY